MLQTFVLIQLIKVHLVIFTGYHLIKSLEICSDVVVEPVDPGLQFLLKFLFKYLNKEIL